MKQRTPNTAAEPPLLSISFTYHSTSGSQYKARETRMCLLQWYVGEVVFSASLKRKKITCNFFFSIPRSRKCGFIFTRFHAFRCWVEDSCVSGVYYNISVFYLKFDQVRKNFSKHYVPLKFAKLFESCDSF